MNTNFIERTTCVKECMVKLFGYITMLNDFIAKPDETTEDIIASNCPDLSEYFNNIKLGLIGDATRSRAVELGRSKIFNQILLAKTDVLNAYSALKDIPDVVINIVKENFATILKTTESLPLSTRKTSFLENDVSKEYMGKKMIITLEPLLPRQLGADVTIAQYMQKIISVLSMVGVYDFSLIDSIKGIDINLSNEIQKINALAKNKTTFDALYVVPEEDTMKDIDAVESIEVVNDKLTTIKVDDAALEAFINGKDSLFREKPISDNLIMLSAVIDALAPIEAKLKNNVDDFSNAAGKSLKNDTNFITVLESLVEGTVATYNSGNSTAGDFDTEYTLAIKVLTGTLMAYVNYVIAINNLGVTVNEDLATYHILYNTISDVCIAGTYGKDTTVSLGKRG